MKTLINFLLAIITLSPLGCYSDGEIDAYYNCLDQVAFINTMIDERIYEQPDREDELNIKRKELIETLNCSPLNE